MAALAAAVVASPGTAQEVPAVAADVAAFDPAPWLADYEALKETMARGYANLDWIVARRGLDLAELDRRITARLEAAASQREAIAAISEFTEAFGDNHLRGAPGRASPWALRNARPIAADLPPAAGGDAGDSEAELRSLDCAGLGYHDGARLGVFDPSKLPEWTLVPSPHFTAGTSGRIGFIRLHSFGESEYLKACEAGWQPGRTERETQLATRAVLQDELARLAAALRAAGAELLALDITANGGGSEWSEEAAALFTADELTRPSPRLVVPCGDRSGVWRGEAVCANLAPAGGIDRKAGLGAWDGPLAILVAGKSASAAEDFAYWLAGSGAAKLVGERTFGSGCGYVDGGWAYQFSAIDGHVMMPNCSRYTIEGVNQVEGLQPDVAFDWSGSPVELAAMLDSIAS